MLVSNERDYHYMLETVTMLFSLIEWLTIALGITFEFINMGGGLGIPYKPDERPLNLAEMAAAILSQFRDFGARNGYMPRLYMESGRFVTGPHGILITRVINHKYTYRDYVGVDANMSALMRPGMYGAYHHIDVLGKTHRSGEFIVDVVGSLCENNDKFAVQRALPEAEVGDLLIIHDTGAHGYSMGFNYNGRLRPKELLLRQDGSVELIRREEMIEDYFATLTFQPDRFKP